MISMYFSKKAIALGSRLNGCNNVITLGVKPNFSDYTTSEAGLIHTADKIYYPSAFYADLFDVMGKPTFPGYHTYKCVQDKIKQTAMFYLLNIPHPRTRIFYGRKQKVNINEQFSFPFIAKVPRGSAMGRGVFLIRNNHDLEKYCRLPSPAYIQEYLETDSDIRVVVIGKKAVLAYRRIAPCNDFRSNVSVGSEICLDPVSQEALDLALYTADKCRWDDVGIDIILHQKKYYVIEANVKYGRKGFEKAGIDYISMMESMIDKKEI